MCFLFFLLVLLLYCVNCSIVLLFGCLLFICFLQLNLAQFRVRAVGGELLSVTFHYCCGCYIPRYRIGCQPLMGGAVGASARRPTAQ